MKTQSNNSRYPKQTDDIENQYSSTSETEEAEEGFSASFVYQQESVEKSFINPIQNGDESTPDNPIAPEDSEEEEGDTVLEQLDQTMEDENHFEPLQDETADNSASDKIQNPHEAFDEINENVLVKDETEVDLDKIQDELMDSTFD